MRARSLVIGVAASVMALAPVVATASEVTGSITAVSGNSYIARDGRLLRAVPSMQLVKGDRIVTQASGSAKATLKDGCVVSVANSSSAGVSACGDTKAVDFQRAGATGESSSLRGRAGGGFIIAILAVGAIALGIVAATSSGSRPNSP